MSSPFAKRHRLDLNNAKVMIAMPVHREVEGGTVVSLLATQSLFQSRDIPLDVQFAIGNSLVPSARTRLVDIFLKDKDYTHIFWIDSDITWQPEDALKMAGLATAMDVVCAAYPSKKDNLEFMLDATPGEKLTTNDYGCILIRGVGLGFTVVQRHIIEKLAADAMVMKFPDIPEPVPHIFKLNHILKEFRGEMIPHFQGEDMAFFSDIRQLGYPIWLEPTITLGHTGPKEYIGAVVDVLNAAEAAA